MADPFSFGGGDPGYNPTQPYTLSNGLALQTGGGGSAANGSAPSGINEYGVPYQTQPNGTVVYGYTGGGSVGGGAANPALAQANTNTQTTQPAGGQTFSAANYQAPTQNFGFGSTSGQNPYLSQMAQAMGNQLTQNFQRNTDPMISSGALAVGGYGGSRQGVVEANALNDMQNQYANGLANLYGNSYGQSLNYNLGLGGLQNQAQANANNYSLGLGGLANQAQSNANSYNLGMNNNALWFANLDANINQNNVQNQLAGANFGLGLSNQSLQNANTGITAGTTLQNTPYGYYSNFANLANGIGQGYGTTSSTSSASGSPLTGALAGYQLYNAWNKGNSTNYPGGSGWGTDLGSR